MEDELQAAVSEYRSQLAAVEALLAEDPDSAEVREMYDTLQSALQYTLAVLAQVAAQPPHPPQEQQQQEQLEYEQQQEQHEQLGSPVQQPQQESSQHEAATAAESTAGGDVYTGGSPSYPGPCPGPVATTEAAEGAKGSEGASRPEAAVEHAATTPAAEHAAAGAGGTQVPRGGAVKNARMHPANRYYRQEPDFGALARQYEELRPYVHVDSAGRAHMDSTSWSATRALTACLLHKDFGVTWGLPEGQLVPPITNRANYIHWINDLLHLSAPEGDAVRGLDVGCGANFIYCLLGAVLYGWRMVGVDVTQVAVQSCRQLIADNPLLAHFLEVRDLSYLHPELQGFENVGMATTDTGPQTAAPAAAVATAAATGSSDHAAGGPPGRKRLAVGQDPHDGAADYTTDTRMKGGFAMGPEGAEGTEGEQAKGRGGEGAVGAGGPGGEAAAAGGDDDGSCIDTDGNEKGILLPVFADADETFAFTMCNPPFFESMQEAAQNPNTAFGGTSAEMVCPGGELAFVLRMLVESEEMRDRVHWFSTMVGKKSTLKALRRELHCRHVTALRTTELAQGRTSRWAVAWSWQVHPNKASQPLRKIDTTPTHRSITATVASAETRTGGPPSATAAAAAVHVAASAVPPHSVAPAATCAVAASEPTGRSVAGGGLPILPRRHVSFTVRLAGSAHDRTFLHQVQQLLSDRGCGPLSVHTAAWELTWPLQVGPFITREAETVPEQLGASLGNNNIMARLRIAQQQRGRVEVVATIPNTAPDAAARAFAAIMGSLETALNSAGGRI